MPAMRKSIPYRLGLDLGTNSIGWCVTDLGKPDKDGRMHPVRIRRVGVRIFPDGRDPQSGDSLAKARREPRSARRRRDRFLDRRADLMCLLIQHGLMPADPAERKTLAALDPWRLRAEGLDRLLAPHEFGRTLFHLNQRRGFKSNRKTDKKADERKEAQGMKAGAIALSALLNPDTVGRRTLGEYLYATRRKDRTPRGAADGSKKAAEAVRFRARIGKGGRAEWDLYPIRAMVDAEFATLWASQVKHGAALTDAARAAIHDAIFFQRPLRAVEPGPCTFDPEPDPAKRDRRAPLALPNQQEFRMLQELANLELSHKRTGEVRRLTRSERDKVLFELKRREKFTFTQIRKRLGIEAAWAFNLQSDRREDLKGDVVAYRLANDKAFGKRWHELPPEKRNEIVEFLLDEEREEEVVGVATGDWGLEREAAAYVAGNVSLPEGYGRIGRVALAKIVPMLHDGVSPKDGGLMRYDEAVRAAGYEHHSDFRTGEVFDEAPYYGQILERYMAPVGKNSGSPDEERFGRIANPTVHVGLNQLRQLLNALIRAYGHPAEIVVELARDLKQTQEQRKEADQRQTENQKKNERRKADLAASGIPMRGDALLRMQLWEELGENIADRKCVYTGEQIGLKTLFSDKVEIEHILPFKLTLDDSPTNLTVSIRRANRDKGNRTPFDAFHADPNYDWPAVALRASALPRSKQWRFRPDALQLIKDRLLREEERAKGSLPKDVIADIEGTGGFLARQLVDTAYLARVSRQYLTSVVPTETDDDGTVRSKVWVIPGGMTGMLRRLWGFNRYLWGNRPGAADEGPDDWRGKLRTDHRHHAVDAFVLTLVDRSLLGRIQRQSGQSGHRTIDDMPEPADWPGFREDLKAQFDRIVVSYKPEHDASGRLHEETAYGIVRDPAKEEGATLAYRKPFADLNANEIERIRDKKLRTRVLSAVAGVKDDKKKLKEAMVAFASAERQPIRHVRLLKTEMAFEPIKDRRSGKPYRAVIPGENHAVDIVRLPDGKWIGEGITRFDAARSDFSPNWRREHAGAALVMRVHKGDLLKLEHDGAERIFRVVKLVPGNNLFALAGQLEAGSLQKRHDDADDIFRWVFLSFSQMQGRKARKITVDLLGRAHDPGPPK